MQALLLDRLERDAEVAALGSAGEGAAWAAFERALRFVAHAQLEDRALKQLVGGTVAETEELTAARRQLFALAAELAARAQEEGSLRADFERGDLPLLFGGVAQSEWLSGDRAVERDRPLRDDRPRRPASAGPDPTRRRRAHARGGRGDVPRLESATTGRGDVSAESRGAR